MNKNATSARPNIPNLTVLPGMGAGRPEEDSHRTTTRARPEGARKIERTIQYMLQHLNQPLQVSDLAETAHTSPSHFFVLFKRWVGLSPIDYFIRLRMRQACRLLGATSMSVKEVAAVLGYDDPFYFSRVFKSVNGTPPTDYRLRMEAVEQGQRRGAVLPMGEDVPLPRLPLAEEPQNDGGNQRRSGQEPSNLHSARRILSLS